MRLSVLIPVFNEEKTIAILLTKVLKQKNVWEVIIVDDGSTDQTVAKIGLIKNSKIRLFRHPQNIGKGAAIVTAVSHAQGDILLTQDADLECDPVDYPGLIKPLLEKKADFVSGNRWKNFKIWTFGRLGNICLTKFYNLLYGASLEDMCSCYKVSFIKTWHKMKLKSRGFEIESEIMAKTRLLNLKVQEVPVKYLPRKYKEGKKIHPFDGILGALTLLRLRLTKTV